MERIYNQLPAPFIPHMIKYVSKPFEDLRYAVYHFMQVNKLRKGRERNKKRSNN
jgi:hypothetical protein